jgi:hypothetical protein
MSEALQERVVELLWRHWTALGVAGVAPLPEHAIDVEALIAFTPFVAAAEPRLERECVDWCVRIGRTFVSVSRLRQIVRLMPEREGTPDLATLFLQKANGKIERLSEKSRPPRLEHPSLLQLRSRYIFGVGARADVVAALVMRARDDKAARISAIRPTGYTKQAVATVMDELAEAGVLEKLVGKKAVSYRVVKDEPLRSLLAPLPKRTPRWPERFALIASVLQAWQKFGARASYEIELAKVLAGLRPLAATIDEQPPVVGRPQAIRESVQRWTAKLLDM